MKRIACVAATVLLGLAASAPAQTAAPAPTTAPAPLDPADDPGVPHTPLPYGRAYDKPSARTDAINAPNAGALAAANRASADQSAARATFNADEQARYDQDMAAYRAALVARHRVADADARIYEHRQRAYADAMFAWRDQVAACRRGHRAACDAPAPDPAAFW